MLGGGGIRGWAHAGVLRVLHQAGVPIDLIVGASAGALMGPLYAARRDAEEMARVALSFTLADFVEWFLKGLRISPEGGRIARRLWESYGRLDIRELAVAFAATALDVEGGERRVLTEGSTARAVEASIRPPVLLRPVLIEGRYLVDGGMHDTVPVDVAYALGARAVIAVNVGEFVLLPPPLRPLAARWAAFCRHRAKRGGDLWAQVGFMAHLLSQGPPCRPEPQVIIRPALRGISALLPWQAAEAFHRGEAAARRALPLLRQVLAERD